MADIRSRALNYLREGKVAVLYARTKRTDRTPCELVAVVHGHQDKYVIDLSDGIWKCSCLKVDRSGQCAHLAAVQLITGHESAAAKPAKAKAAAA